MKTCNVFYVPEMVATVKSYSPSPGKPKLVVADWKKRRLPINLVAFQPLSVETASLAHNPWHVRDILNGTKPNGFGHRDVRAGKTFLYTTAAMLHAARDAMKTGVACAPVSGFHHAGYNYAGAFCTFNGLMIAAIALKKTGIAGRVGILDLDQHYGDGTVDIIQKLNCESWLPHITLSGNRPKAEDFLKKLPGLIRKTYKGCGVLLYQAGADPHVNDPLGGWMTTAQLAERDRIVFTTAKAMGLPVAWNLAGGYQTDKHGGIPAVLEIHRNTMKACLAA